MGPSKWAREIIARILRAKQPTSHTPAPYNHDVETELAYALDDAKQAGLVDGLREAYKLIGERISELEPEPAE